LRYFDGKTVKDIGDVGAWEVPRQKFGSDESLFFSFSARDFNQLFVSGATFELGQSGAPEKAPVFKNSFARCGFPDGSITADKRHIIVE
jgi:hypothetical protein